MTLRGLRSREFVNTMYSGLQCTWSSSFVTANFDSLKRWWKLQLHHILCSNSSA